jgi:hypothetical protein
MNAAVRLPGPTENDLKELAKAERAHRAAIMLPKSHRERADRIDKAVKAKQTVQNRIATREQFAFNAAALAEDAKLESLRGGTVVEDSPRTAPGRRRRLTGDGLSFVLEKAEDAETHAVRLTMRRLWVAGMLYRDVFEREHGDGLGAVDLDSSGGGMLDAKLARERALVAGADGDRILREVAKALACSPRGRRELHVLQQVAGWGRSLRSVTSGASNIYRAELALLRALDTVAWVLKLS